MSWTMIGHRRAVRSLQRAVASGTLTHAYLITGPAQIGKRTLARELAAALNCDAPPRERPCHGCRNCRMTAHEQHPDLIVVAPSWNARRQSVAVSVLSAGCVRSS